MLHQIISLRLDAAVFVTLLLGLTWLVHVWLKRRQPRGIPRTAWVATLIVALLGMAGGEWFGEDERHRLRDRLAGIAPTYAQEMELLGHAQLADDASGEDPAYLRMIEAQKRWQSVNPNVSDIYTYRKNADGQVILIVDSETDYNHNGQYDGEREERTAIGEAYEETTPNFLAALDGNAGFDDVPDTDPWGTWVSAYVPLRGADGKIEGALGVDYDASRWNGDIARTRAIAFLMAGLLWAVVLAAATIVTITRSEMAERERLQRQLVDASRQAGMAEVATGVLHNVGNVLNSVNVSAGLIAEKIRGSKLAGFTKAADMIREHREDLAGYLTQDNKGKLLPDYLLKLSDLLKDEQQQMTGELSQLSRSLDHIKQIVASQQALATRSDVVESFEMPDVLDDALRINGDLIKRHEVQVDVQSHASGLVEGDRHKVLQILVNLISNAAKAMAERDERRLTITMEHADGEQGRDIVRVQVADTGCGIDAAALPRLFAHGYTTRADGHGFGLHHSAIAAHNLGGSLHAASEGMGRGATFTLEIPVHPLPAASVKAAVEHKEIACQQA